MTSPAVRSHFWILLFAAFFSWVGAGQAGAEIDTGPWLHLGLDESAGTAAFDSSGHGNHGSYGADVVREGVAVVEAGARATSPGGYGGDVADAITVPSLLPGVALGELSVAFWYRLPANPHDGYLFSWGGSNNADNQVSLYLDVGVALRVRVHSGGDYSTVLLATPPGFDDGAWHHVAIVKNAAGTTLFFDGVFVKARPYGMAPVVTSGLFRLGTNELGHYGIEAGFDEVMVFDRALSSSEIGRLHAWPGSGHLAVQLGPAAIEGLGLRWRLKNGPDLAWHASGDKIFLAAGAHEVETETTYRWSAPSGASLQVLPGVTNLFVLAYAPILPPALAQYGLDEKSGTVAADASGSGRNGEYGSRVARDLLGIAGRAVQTAGIGASAGTLADGLQVASLATGATYTGASVSLWYRLPAEPHDGYLFGWGGTNTAANSISLFMDVGGGLRLRVHAAGETASSILATPPGFDDTAWHHLVVVKEATGSRAYLDGQEVYAGTMGAGTFKPPLGFYLGTNQTGAFGIEASFDQVEVFGQAMTPAQVAALYGPGAPPAAFGGDYRTGSEIEAALHAAVAARPDLVRLIDFGDSFAKTQAGVFLPTGDLLAGHDLLAVELGRGGESSPVLVLTGGQHAREIAPPELVLRFLDWLLTEDGVDADATWLLDHHRIVLAPLVDPDGHDLVEFGGLAANGARPNRWRKNARPLAGCPWPATDAGNGSGVDLNRNFPLAWGTSNDRAGSSSRCDPYYRGAAAASEPETLALMNLVAGYIPDQRAPALTAAAADDATGIFIQLHSPYRTVGWPWAHSTSAPPNAADLAAIGKELASYGNYAYGQIRSEIYEMTGSAESWVYSELGAAAFLVEVGEGLMPAYGRLGNVLWPEVKGALIYAAKIARAPYLLSRGPVISLAAAAYGPAGIAVSGQAKEGQGQPVVAAEVYFDLPPWSPGAVAWPLDAGDGAFGGTVENLAGLPAPSLAPGKHLAFLRARDLDGNWGPVSAAFVTVP